MDEVVEAVEKAKQEWEEAYAKTQIHIKSIEEYRKSGDGIEGASSQEKNSLPRLNGLAQDGLALLQSLEFKLDLLAPQLPADDQVKSAQSLLESWKKQSHSLRLSLRNANLQAKANLRKAAQDEVLLIKKIAFGRWRRVHSSQAKSTVRNMTKAGMTSAAESITESLRRTRQLMVQWWAGGGSSSLLSEILSCSLFQEVERSSNTLMTFDESTGVLRKAESEYKGHRSLLMRTRNLLSTMQRHDVIDRLVIAVGFFLFSCAVLYVVSKRIGLLRLQRTVTAAIKAGMAGKGGREAVEEGIKNLARIPQNADPQGLLKHAMHDEL
ncbi:unnamed protein product [Linum tenue]|uniref:Sec20 C-terminal domain-containing protein n=1 Tax=Linum tenue TaxID=586396 RepID=A0AAV0LPX1_9ROSI|nr:unnamed protein product [Linum tenue]